MLQNVSRETFGWQIYHKMSFGTNENFINLPNARFAWVAAGHSRRRGERLAGKSQLPVMSQPNSLANISYFIEFTMPWSMPEAFSRRLGDAPLTGPAQKDVSRETMQNTG